MLNKSKTILTFLSIFLVISLISCNNPSGGNKGSKEEPTPTEKGFYAPETIKVVKSSDKSNTVVISWLDTDAETCFLYYCKDGEDEKNAKYVPVVRTLAEENGVISYELKLSETGKYFFWVKAVDMNLLINTSLSSSSAKASIEFEYKELEVPGKVLITKGEKLNQIELKWVETDAPVYWLYQNTLDTTLTAKKVANVITELNKDGGYVSYTLTLTESDTYYFWLKAANGINSDSEASDFSESQKYTFTYTELSAPTNLVARMYDQYGVTGIELEWTSAKAPCYYIYWSKKEDSTSATILNRFCTNTKTTIYSNLQNLTEGTTYYFWVKSADSSSEDSYTSDFSDVASILYE